MAARCLDGIAQSFKVAIWGQRSHSSRREGRRRRKATKFHFSQCYLAPPGTWTGAVRAPSISVSAPGHAAYLAGLPGFQQPRVPPAQGTFAAETSHPISAPCRQCHLQSAGKPGLRPSGCEMHSASTSGLCLDSHIGRFFESRLEERI